MTGRPDALADPGSSERLAAYDVDVLAWSQRQALLLRRVAASGSLLSPESDHADARLQSGTYGCNPRRFVRKQ
jgi:hypothetical protein